MDRQKNLTWEEILKRCQNSGIIVLALDRYVLEFPGANKASQNFMQGMADFLGYATELMFTDTQQAKGMFYCSAERGHQPGLELWLEKSALQVGFFVEIETGNTAQEIQDAFPQARTYNNPKLEGLFVVLVDTGSLTGVTFGVGFWAAPPSYFEEIAEKRGYNILEQVHLDNPTGI